MSPGKYGMSGRAAKVKPGSEPPPQDPGGRLRGTNVLGLLGNDVGRWCACSLYPPSTPGDSEVLLKQKRRSDTPGLPGSRRRIWNGSP